MGNRLYVGNLSFNATNDTVRAAFSAFGEITDVHVVSDRETGQSRGFGFVTMGSAEAAQKAISEMNGAMLDGRALKVNEAEERQGGGGGGRGGGGGGGAAAAAAVVAVAAAVAGKQPLSTSTSRPRPPPVLRRGRGFVLSGAVGGGW